MLVKPSVTPKDRDDYVPAYSKRRGPDEPHMVKSTSVRFNPDARQIPSGNEYSSGEGEDGSREDDEEEDFPVRRKPARGRKQTGLPAKLITTSDDGASVAQAPRHHTGVSQDSSDAPVDATDPALKPHKGLSMGMASRIAGAFKANKKRAEASHDEDISINVSTLSVQDSEPSEAAKSNKGGVMYTPEAFAPVFAEGISLFQPKATYNSKDSKDLQKNMRNLPMGKHAFARLVDSARHHHKGTSKEESEKRSEPPTVNDIAPGPRAKLLELAKTAKIKAQQKPSGLENGAGDPDDEPGWNCAGLSRLQDSKPPPSLTVQPATPQSSLDREREHRRAHDRAIKKSASRSRLVEQARAKQAEDVVWIGRDGEETMIPEERRHHHSHGHRHRSERSRSRHRPQQESSHSHHHHRPSPDENSYRDRDDREHRRTHRTRHPEEHRVHHSSSHHVSHESRSTEQLPDKRKGKVLETGAETQRLNMALNMARTRKEMEIAEQQEAKQTTNGARVEREVKEDEEKAWLEEAYEEAFKKEVEYKYLYEAHSLGGTW